MVRPVGRLVSLGAVKHHAATRAPQQAQSRFRLVHALGAHVQRFHLILKLESVHGCVCNATSFKVIPILKSIDFTGAGSCADSTAHHCEGIPTVQLP